MAAGGDAYLAHEISRIPTRPRPSPISPAAPGVSGSTISARPAAVANNEADLAPEGAESIRRFGEGDRLKRETLYRHLLRPLVPRGAAGPSRPRRAHRGAGAARRCTIFPRSNSGLAVARDAPGRVPPQRQGDRAVLPRQRVEPAMRRLLERRPASSSLADLVEARMRSFATKCARRCARRRGRMLAVSTVPVHCAAQLAERPKSGRWRRWTPRTATTRRRCAIPRSRSRRFSVCWRRWSTGRARATNSSPRRLRWRRRGS